MKLKITVAAFLAAVLALFAGCSSEYVLNEKTFFTVMTNIQNYPSKYMGKTIEFDCFTYELTDSEGNSYLLGVRKCSAGVGCTCGNDTVIGFILQYDGEIPAPVNQSGDDNEKTWIHVRGALESTVKKDLSIFAYDSAGNATGATETVSFLTFCADTLSVVEDYSGLNYYVTK